jgi:hypothetical protein
MPRWQERAGPKVYGYIAFQGASGDRIEQENPDISQHAVSASFQASGQVPFGLPEIQA